MYIHHTKNYQSSLLTFHYIDNTYNILTWLHEMDREECLRRSERDRLRRSTWPTTTPCTVRGEHNIVASDTPMPWSAIPHHVALHIELHTPQCPHVTIQITRFTVTI